MDPAEEDVSARVLLRNVLRSQPSRSPLTRSVSREQVLGLRRTPRGKNSSGLQTPQLTLRHKLKQKLHETATQSPLPPSKRPRSMGRKGKTTAASPALCDTDVTPRGLLRGFIQTEAEASLLLSGQPALPKAHLQPAETSNHSSRQSEGGNGFDLPDLATEPLSHVIRGMSRRRPAPTFSVSAFEKELDQQSGEGEENHENTDVTENLSAGTNSVLSLTLKTPFVSDCTERAGLQRKAAQRKKPSVHEFDEAVEKQLERHRSEDYTVMQARGTPANQSIQEFTLGLSSVVMSNTELYGQLASSATELREKDGASENRREKSFEAEAKGDEEVDKENLNVLEDDKQSEHVSETSKTEPEPLQEMEYAEPASQSQEEKVPSSEEKDAATLSPDERALAPTQMMAEEKEMEQTEVEGMDWRGSVNEGLLYQLSEQIIWRDSHSEGGGILPRVTASGSGRTSTGAELQSFTGVIPEESLASKDPSPSPPPLSVCPSPGTCHTILAEVDDGKGVAENNVSKLEIIDGDVNQSEDEMVPSPNHLSPALHFPAVQEEQEDEEDAESEELSMQTPAFIRQRKEVASPSAVASPIAFRTLPGPAGGVVKPRPRQKRQTESDNVLPKSYVMSVFKHFAKTRVASDVYPVINDILQKYFSRLADDLEVYSAHAKRKTIEVEDVELLMKRQGFVTDRTPLTVLIEKFLPLEYRKLLIPVATSGNKVIPSQKR